ncbi:transketolase C-terminal domain-containing protein [Micromonosporaceae bacterium DT55]|uniref:transketolase C-terminal domain-containing protein n=1 Tax=Melissospora conviva TaxID=3388432 RepID=UPI003C23B9B0
MTTPQDLDAHFRQAVAELAGADPSPAPADVPRAAPDQRDAETQGDAETPDGAEVRESAAVEGGAESEESAGSAASAASATDVGEASTGDPGTQVADDGAYGALRPLRDPAGPVRDGTALTGALARELVDAQIVSRHLDLAARWLHSFGEGYDTVGSAGHEGNAAVAAALRPTDPVLLHHRSQAFYCRRAMEVAAVAPEAGTPDDPALPALHAARDLLRTVVGSAQALPAGARQKVFTDPALAVLPTGTSLAGHLPRAVGVAFAVERLRRQSAAARRGAAAPVSPWPADAIVACSFGDTGLNHAATTAALNTAGWCDQNGVRLPLLLVCEDNGLGPGLRSPQGWAAAVLRSRPGLRYFDADGTDLAATYDAATEAAGWVRRERHPAVLHLRTVRLMGHDGADNEAGYRLADEIRADRERDPLLAAFRLLVEAGLATAEELADRYDALGWRFREIAEEVIGEPKPIEIAEIVGPQAPRRPVRVSRAVTEAATRAAGPGAAARLSAFDGELPEKRGTLTLAQSINATLADALLDHPAMTVFGADVAATGGAHGVTRGLRDRFGGGRVFDTVGDQTSLLGLALGAGAAGLLPVPEIGNLAQLGAGVELLRDAVTTRQLSAGGVRSPLVLRMPGLAHPDSADGTPVENSVAALRDIPGLVIAVPARAEDATGMLRSCLAAAAVDGSVCVFLEPVAAYGTRDLHADGDDSWCARYPAPGEWGTAHVPIGRARSYGFGSAEDLTIVTFGNGVRMSLRVAQQLAGEGVGTRVVDLRWLAPLPVADLIREAAVTGRVLVVDETRRSGGVGEGVLAALVDAGYVGAARRVAAVDGFVPLGPAARAMLISEETITQGARTLLAR